MSCHFNGNVVPDILFQLELLSLLWCRSQSQVLPSLTQSLVLEGECGENVAQLVHRHVTLPMTKCALWSVTYNDLILIIFIDYASVSKDGPNTYTSLLLNASRFV